MHTLKCCAASLGAVRDTSMSGARACGLAPGPCSTCQPEGMSTATMAGGCADGASIWGSTTKHKAARHDVSGTSQHDEVSRSCDGGYLLSPLTGRASMRGKCYITFLKLSSETESLFWSALTCNKLSKGGLGLPLKLNPNSASTTTSATADSPPLLLLPCCCWEAGWLQAACSCSRERKGMPRALHCVTRPL